METIIKLLVENPIISAVLTSSIGVILGFAAYKALLKIILSEKNIIKVADAIDKVVDQIQKKDKESGKETRAILIKLAERIIKDLKEADGTN